MFFTDDYSQIEFEQTLERNIPDASVLGKEFTASFAFRSMAQKYANSCDAISGVGSLYVSGRYNIGKRFGGNLLSDTIFQDYRFKVLYLSCDLVSCVAEIEYYAVKDATGIFNDKEKVANALAQTLVGVNLNISKCLDLRDDETLRAIGLTDEVGQPDGTVLKMEWFPFNFDGQFAPTQLIGKVAKDKGYEAIIAPSARLDDNCRNSINLLSEDVIQQKATLVNAHLLPDSMPDFYTC